MRKTICLLSICGLICSASSGPALGITIRDDRSDSQYTSLASTSYAFGGYLATSGASSYYGSAVLISKDWVLSRYTKFGASAYFKTSSGDSIAVTNVYRYSDSESDGLALGRLASSVTDITPTKLYGGTSVTAALGQEAIITGAGYGGLGSTGYDTSTSCGILRAAEAYVSSCSSSTIETLFRDPTANNSAAADIEGGTSIGDGGGGLFLSVNGEAALAGICSYAIYDNEATVPISLGAYGSGGGFIRTTAYNEWIRSYATDAQIVSVPEPPSLVLLLIALSFLFHSYSSFRSHS